MSKTNDYVKDAADEKFTFSDLILFLLSLAFIIYFLKTQASFIPEAIREWLDRPTPGSMELLDANHTFDPTRMGYDFGNARTLTKDAHVVLFYADDEEGQWTAEESEQFTQSAIQPALDYLEETAASYGYDIDLSVTSYSAAVDGIIDNHMGTADGQLSPGLSDTEPLYNFTVVSKLAASLGYEGNVEMHEALCKELNTEQIAYIIIPKKSGWPYAVAKNSEKTNYNLEFCYIYWQNMHGILETAPTVAHEVLHLFGAEDLYQSGSENLRRSALAIQLHPGEIMLGTSEYLSDNPIGRFTAYTVGWLDELPPEYDCEDWWN